MAIDPKEEERGLNFRQTRIIKAHVIPFRMPLTERLRAARRVPQAVVKVVSFARGYKRVKKLMNYISREGKLPLETETGEWIMDVEGQRSLAKDWARTFDRRINSRDVVHLVFSMPKGSSAEALRASVRTVVTRHFPGHEAVWAIHEDQAHPHAHVLMKMRARGQEKKLRFKKQDLYRLREAFAEAAREQGVQLAASPRAARGVGKRFDRQAVNRLRRKGVVPKSEKQTALELLKGLKSGGADERPWEARMVTRNQLERSVYRKEAERLRILAPYEEQGTREALLRAAQDIEQFAKTMPTPMTRRQAMKNDLYKSSPTAQPKTSPQKTTSSEVDR